MVTRMMKNIMQFKKKKKKKTLKLKCLNIMVLMQETFIRTDVCFLHVYEPHRETEMLHFYLLSCSILQRFKCMLVISQRSAVRLEW